MGNPEEMFSPNTENKRTVTMFTRVFIFGAVALGLPTAICWATQFMGK